MSSPRAADDFATIRARLDELRRERAAVGVGDARSGESPAVRAESDLERRRRARTERWPPPWAPTIFARRQRS